MPDNGDKMPCACRCCHAVITLQISATTKFILSAIQLVSSERMAAAHRILSICWCHCSALQHLRDAFRYVSGAARNHEPHTPVQHACTQQAMSA